MSSSDELRSNPEAVDNVGTHRRHRKKKNLERLGWGLVSYYSWLKYRGVYVSEFSFREPIQTIRWTYAGRQVVAEQPRSLAWGEGMPALYSTSIGAFDYVIQRSHNASYSSVIEVKYNISHERRHEIFDDFRKLVDLPARGARYRFFIYIGDDKNFEALQWQNVRYHNYLFQSHLNERLSSLIDVPRTKTEWLNGPKARAVCYCVFTFHDASGRRLCFTTEPEKLLVTLAGHKMVCFGATAQGELIFSVTPGRAQGRANLVISFSARTLTTTVAISARDGAVAGLPAVVPLTYEPRDTGRLRLADLTIDDFRRVFRLDNHTTQVRIDDSCDVSCQLVFDTSKEKPLDAIPPIRVAIWRIDVTNRSNAELVQFDRIRVR